MNPASLPLLAHYTWVYANTLVARWITCNQRLEKNPKVANNAKLSSIFSIQCRAARGICAN